MCRTYRRLVIKATLWELSVNFECVEKIFEDLKLSIVLIFFFNVKLYQLHVFASLINETQTYFLMYWSRLSFSPLLLSGILSWIAFSCFTLWHLCVTPIYLKWEWVERRQYLYEAIARKSDATKFWGVFSKVACWKTDLISCTRRAAAVCATPSAVTLTRCRSQVNPPPNLADWHI